MPFASAEARKAYFRERYRRLREAWFKANGPCRRCGNQEDLQVDHVDPLSKVAEAAIWNWSDERRARELAKCQVLCGACHKEKSRAEATGRPRHWQGRGRRALEAQS